MQVGLKSLVRSKDKFQSEVNGMKRSDKEKAIFWQRKIVTLQKRFNYDKVILKKELQKELDICTRMLEQYE